MRRLVLLGVIAATLAGCGGGGSSSSTSTTVSVIVSPSATQTVTQGGTVTFTATVKSTDNTTGAVTDITSTGVTWQVDGTTGGSAQTGTISTSGVYTAPGTINVPIAVTVTALSVKDSTKGASVTIELQPLPQVSIAPTTATVGAGQTVTFTPTYASSVPQQNQVVAWSVNGISGGNTMVGTISPSGVYTAPQVPINPGGQVTVTATLVSEPTQIATAQVTGAYSPGSLQCSYAFLIRGVNTHGPFVRAGSFTADGNGGITGIEDINGGGITATAVQFTGTYKVTADGRGTMLFHDNYGSNFGATNDSSFTIAVSSTLQIQVAESDAFASGNGQADLQSCASPVVAAPFSGTYVFDFSGTDSTSNPLSLIGEYVAASNGSATSGGAEDSNDNGTLSQSASVTFSYQLGSSGGRGTATLVDGGGTKQLSFYAVSSTRLRFIELDSSPVVAGDAVAQAAPPAGGFNAADLGHNSFILTTGTSSNGFITTAAVADADGSGNLQTGTLTQNNAGSVTTGAPFTGTYSVTANGRGTATLSSGQSYVFYLLAQSSAVIQETDHAIVSDGILTTLTTSPPPLLSLDGSFALRWGGAGASAGEQDATGQFTALSGQFKSGTLDRNTANGVSLASGFTPSAGFSLTPTTPYAISPTTNLINITVGNTTLQFAVFFTSQTSATILRVDMSDTRALIGVMARQY